MTRRETFSLRWIALLAAAACSSEPTGAGASNGPASSPPVDAPTPSEDAPSAPSLAPARKPSSVPRIDSYGGPVMRAPKIVPVFFPQDALAPRLRAFVDKIGPSEYWRATTSEYGVGPATAGATVNVPTAAPARTTADEITAWLADRLDGTHPEWGAADENAIYAIFYPTTTVITAKADESCKTFGGYHGDTPAGGKTIVYAVLPRCPVPNEAQIDGVTEALSHELIEAATDPRPTTAPAFVMADADHFAWGLTMGSELGDMCGFDDYRIRPAELGFVVQRTWSNRAAAAGKHPCVPQPSGQLYFNAVPTLADRVDMDLGADKLETAGIRLAIGATKTIDVTLFADSPSAAEWSVSAFDLPTLQGGSAELRFRVDPPTGRSGDVVRLTIERVRSGTQYGGTTFVVRSRLATAQTQNLWVGFVAN